MATCQKARLVLQPWRHRYLWLSLLDLPIYLRIKRQWLKDPSGVTGKGYEDIHPQFKSWVRKHADRIYWTGLGDHGLNSLQIVIQNWELRFKRASLDGKVFFIWMTESECINKGEQVFVQPVCNVKPGGTLEPQSLSIAIYRGAGAAELPDRVLVESSHFWTRTPEWER